MLVLRSYKELDQTKVMPGVPVITRQSAARLRRMA